MNKFYRVLKESPLWDEGAIISDETYGSGNGYKAIDQVYVHDKCEHEYISSPIVESQPDWFERVYPVNLVSKTVYKLKAEAKEILSKLHK